ncbi:MAG TPA: hypothetical protein VKS79_05910 [Gemmataceae bacterium]|nr:hypothetical protein [Gemmataceae bacterium]
MQANFHEMNEIERRLAACAPAGDGLKADAMLFAAGRASARRSPATFLWPVAFTALSLLTITVYSMWMNEHQERIAMASQLRQILMAAPTSPLKPGTAPEEYDRGSGGLLEVHRALEQNRDPLPAEPEIFFGTSRPSPEPEIMRADSLNHMLEP